jgi:hypothetical protein
MSYGNDMQNAKLRRQGGIPLRYLPIKAPNARATHQMWYNNRSNNARSCKGMICATPMEF